MSSPAFGDLVEHPFGARTNGVELLGQRQTVRRSSVEPGANLSRQRGDANHEELVEIARGDRQELDALQQWVTARACVVEHALVEREPAQFTIDVQVRIGEIRKNRSDQVLVSSHGPSSLSPPEVAPACPQRYTTVKAGR